jgi:lipid-A-disaccharide synthase
MKYYIIAGEASGDLHGSNLIKALKQADPNAFVRGWGGNLMQDEGAVLVKHYRETAYMGIFEVIAHAKTIAKNFKFCYQDIVDFKPDVVILIDYWGFNSRIASFSKENGIKVFYYIPPKVWVWKESRVKKIRQLIDRVFVIFPFEKDFFEKKHHIHVDYEGNPLIDSIEERKKGFSSREEFLNRNKLSNEPIIALLPGSRKQEIHYLLPVMTELIDKYEGYQFVIAGSSSMDERFYKQNITNTKAKLVIDKTYELLFHAEAAVVASGTATLETALFNIPQVVCYRVFPPTYFIANLLVSVKFFSLVNIIMDEEVVKEFMQHNLDRDITNELSRILNNPDYRKRMLTKYAELREKCGKPGASKRVGELMVKYLNESAAKI